MPMFTSKVILFEHYRYTHTHSVFKAIILNKILYALPVYFGYLNEGQKQI